MRTILVILFFVTTIFINTANGQGITYPRHNGNTYTLQEFVDATTNAEASVRDSLIIEQIKQGNVPDFMRRSVSITDTMADANGKPHRIELFVAPDVISIGNDTDFLRIPMQPTTAQAIADMCNAMLPTCKISDLIHRHSIAKLQPHPMTPDSTMVTIPVFVRHNEIIEEQMRQGGYPTGTFVAGHKKDIVITNRLGTMTGRVHIYGWHYPDGKPIQPPYSEHGDFYADYSHGVRLICKTAVVDGIPMSIPEILRHPTLFRLLSSEPTPMQTCKYPVSSAE